MKAGRETLLINPHLIHALSLAGHRRLARADRRCGTADVGEAASLRDLPHSPISQFGLNRRSGAAYIRDRRQLWGGGFQEQGPAMTRRWQFFPKADVELDRAPVSRHTDRVPGSGVRNDPQREAGLRPHELRLAKQGHRLVSEMGAMFSGCYGDIVDRVARERRRPFSHEPFRGI